MTTYNAESYLHVMMNSLLNQSLHDIEIICVDNCSKDNTQSIILDYAKSDNRIIPILHQKDEGYLCSLKDGVEKSSGEYIAFVDADDDINTNAYYELYNLIKEKDADMLHYGTDVISTVNIRLKSHYDHFLKPKYTNLKGNILFKKMFINMSVDHMLWNKIYRREICINAFKGIERNYLNPATDIYVMFHMAILCNNYISTDEKYYHYKLDLGSNSPTSSRHKRLVSLCNCSWITDDCKDYYKKFNMPHSYDRVFDKSPLLLLEDTVMIWYCIKNYEEKEKTRSYLIEWWSTHGYKKRIIKLLSGTKMSTLRILFISFKNESRTQGFIQAILYSMRILLGRYDI